jgi:hypothetical protein
MKLIEANWNPTNRQLRQFGILCLFALPFVGWFWFADNMPIIIGCAIGGAAVAISAFAFPPILKPLFVGLMLITTPIGMAVGEVALIMIYFTVFLPIGVVFRLMNRDRLQRSLEKNAKSYWNKKRQPNSVANYYRQS